MTTAIAKTGAIPTPRSAAPPRSRSRRRTRLVLAGFVITLGVVSIGAARMQPSRESTNDVSAERALAWTSAGSPWLKNLEIIRLKKQLVRAGYSIKVDGGLDPVTKSALADYAQLDATHPISPFLAEVLRGTVITGFRNPTAWNTYFGLHRPTKFVERPLTGRGGQLDANGNFRPRP